jgi:exonuclease SbcD
VVHFSDLHIGVESYGSTDPETGLSSRMTDILKVFDEVVEYAIGERADIVIFCGDAYKSRDPSQTQQREFAKRIRQLSVAGIPAFLLVGNHDLPNAMGRATTLEIFQTLAVSNIHVGNRPAVHRVNTASGPLQIASLPWLRRTALLGREEGRGLTMEQATGRAQEVLTEAVAFLSREADPSMPTVLAAHASVANARTGSERTMMVGQDPVLLTGNLALSPFDYVALGHIHKAQVLYEHPPIVYSGRLERIDFNEEKDEKGFYVIELDPGASPGSRCVDFRFHSVSARRFLTIETSLEADETNPTRRVLQEVGRYESEAKGAIVRVVVHMPERMEGQLQEAEIRKALKESHYLSLNRDVRRETRVRLGDQPAERLTPMQALELYLDSKKVSPDRKKTLLEYALQVIDMEVEHEEAEGPSA